MRAARSFSYSRPESPKLARRSNVREDGETARFNRGIGRSNGRMEEWRQRKNGSNGRLKKENALQELESLGGCTGDGRASWVRAADVPMSHERMVSPMQQRNMVNGCHGDVVSSARPENRSFSAGCKQCGRGRILKIKRVGRY